MEEGKIKFHNNGGGQWSVYTNCYSDTADQWTYVGVVSRIRSISSGSRKHFWLARMRGNKEAMGGEHATRKDAAWYLVNYNPFTAN